MSVQSLENQGDSVSEGFLSHTRFPNKNHSPLKKKSKSISPQGDIILSQEIAPQEESIPKNIETISTIEAPQESEPSFNVSIPQEINKEEIQNKKAQSVHTLPNAEEKPLSREERRAKRKARRQERMAMRQEKSEAQQKSSTKTAVQTLKELAAKKAEEQQSVKTSLSSQDLINQKQETIKQKALDKLNRANQQIHKISKKLGKEVQENTSKYKENTLKEALTNTMISAGLDALNFDKMNLQMVHSKYAKFVQELQKRQDLFSFRKGEGDHGYIKTNWFKVAAENVGFIFTTLSKCDHEPDLMKSNPPNYTCRKCGAIYKKKQIDPCQHEPDLEKSEHPHYLCVKCGETYTNVNGPLEKKSITRAKVKKRFNRNRVRSKLLKAKMKQSAELN